MFAPLRKETAETVKQIIKTEDAPKAIGPYSQAVVAGGFVFASGQIPTDPATGQFVEGGISEQTEQVLRNLSKVLEAAGTGLGDSGGIILQTDLVLVRNEGEKIPVAAAHVDHLRLIPNPLECLRKLPS